MGHNYVVSGNPKSTGIPQVDGLSTEPLDLGCHTAMPRRSTATLRRRLGRALAWTYAAT